MEKTEKTKKVLTVSVIALLALALVSMCFVFSTMARYTTSGSGTGTMGIAKWDVSIQNASTTVDFKKLSPSQDAFSAGTTRTNSTGKILIATITNNSDVAALVTLANSDPSATLAAGNFLDSESETEENKTNGYKKATVDALFSVKLYVSETNDATAANNEYDAENGIKMAAKSGETGTVRYIFAEITWTSADAGKTAGDTTADDLDTWVGQNGASVTVTFNYTAVQDSELPA